MTAVTLTVSRPLPANTTLVETEPLRVLLAAAPVALKNRRIICVSGDSGCGKSVALDVLKHQLDVPVATVILDRGSTDKQVIEEIYKAVHRQPGPMHSSIRKAEMMAHLRSTLANEQVVLMVDEAQNASLRALELARQLHEDPTSRCGLILSGVNLSEKTAKEPMLHSRIGMHVTFHPLTDGALIDVLRKLHPHLAALPDELIFDIDDSYCRGGLRRWVVFLEWLLAVTGDGTRKPGRKDVEKALTIMTSTAPQLTP